MKTGTRQAGRRAAAVLAAATLLAGCHTGARPLAAPTPTPIPTHLPVVALTSSTPAPAPEPPSVRTVVTRRLATIANRLPSGAVSVAVRNLRTGATYRWGETHGMWMGSTYKLLVLETLLLERQRSGGWLSDYELDDITEMIERSKNKAGYAMYLDAGGSAALSAAARRLGLRHTRIGHADPALTVTSAGDGLILLQHLVVGGPLNAESKAFVLGLMRDVQADQRWGAGVVADRGTAFANKNGWMRVGNTNGPGADDNGHWLVNSLGVVRVGGQRLLISIFTEHNPDCYTGIDLVQRLARTITPVVVTSS